MIEDLFTKDTSKTFFLYMNFCFFKLIQTFNLKGFEFVNFFV